MGKVCGVDLFAGAGGLALGAAWAGVNVVCAVESDKHAASTYRVNHERTKVIVDDIRNVSDLPSVPSGPLILFGGPPCQGFSTSNQRTRTLTNPKNWLFSEVFRIADKLKPDCILLENVTGLQGTAQGSFFNQILKELEVRGYSMEVWNLCAADFGVPQRRNRLFIVGHRLSRPILPPKPTCKKHITVRQAIGDLPELSVGASIDSLNYAACRPSKYAKDCRDAGNTCSGNIVTTNNALVISRYSYIPEGGNWCDIPKQLMLNYTNLLNNRSRHTGIYRRLKWNSPSIVIANFRKNMLVHPEQNRGLSLREAARIQSFPDSYQFSGTLSFMQQQISNAVPPLLAKAVFEQILSSIKA